ncbi:hypothetical protein F4825DRAFT_68629 [Nemania diffusa]|nr:hypothetical protein F4825DRAFT_68629 [Nemania diffusa]
MASTSAADDVLEARRFEGRVIIRRFTDELTGADELERSTRAAQEDIDKEEELEEAKRLRMLYDDPSESGNSPRDFDAAEIARQTLQQMVDKFNQDAKPSVLQRIGIRGKSSAAKSIEMLESSMEDDSNDLKTTVDDLHEKWREGHGPIYKVFIKLCNTFDDHRSIFAIFPSQSDYASVLSASLSCLVKAAKNHSEIAKTLSNSITAISEKVAGCSALIMIIKTPRMRKKLANVYARMFQFYQEAIAWYLQSKFSRLISSFNENLEKGFKEAEKDLDDCLTELHREASIGGLAMIAMLHGKVSALEGELQRQRQNYPEQDTSAGRRMMILMEASWMDNRPAAPNRTLEPSHSSYLAIEPASRIQDVTTPTGITRASARAHVPALEPFIVGDEGSRLLGAGSFWVAEEEVLPKLRAWMVGDKAPRTLWISSPYDIAGMTSARAAALAVVAAAWQAETPIISHFCQRPKPNEVRAGTGVEQMGLIGLVYSLIRQLLQFSAAEDVLDVSAESLTSLDGGNESWDAGLTALRALLDHTPVLMYCVIDGLNDLEWGGGSSRCGQVLEVLLARQRRAGTVFNILITTAGQSRVLPSYVELKDRHMATRGAREVARFGRRIELQDIEHGRTVPR